MSQLAVGLGAVFAAISDSIAANAESGEPHPAGIEFIGALLWRGVVYGAADGLLLLAFPILLVFAALADTDLFLPPHSPGSSAEVAGSGDRRRTVRRSRDSVRAA